MKEPNRYKLEYHSSLKISRKPLYLFIKGEDGNYVKYRNYKRLADRNVVLTNKIEQLEARIKELESEKENAYQEGKLSIVNRLLDSNPEDATNALYELTTTTRMGEEYEERWDEGKLLEYFDINQSFKSKVTELENYCESLYWNALAIKDEYATNIFSYGDDGLKQFIQSKINEIKAQGIEDMLNDDVFKEYVRYSLKGLETTEVDDYTYLENVRNYVEQLRNKHD